MFDDHIILFQVTYIPHPLSFLEDWRSFWERDLRHQLIPLFPHVSAPLVRVNPGREGVLGANYTAKGGEL